MSLVPSFHSIVAPLLVNDIDTDQIIPARFLKATDKVGMGDHLFADWRYRPDGSPQPDFVLNNPLYRNALILLAGDNFGCGSSREHAPWALCGFGFRAIISTSFADIFKSNSLRNGLLPVEVSPETHGHLAQLVEAEPEAQVTIDLESQTLTGPDGTRVTFPIDSFSKYCLIHGVDELGYLLRFEGAINNFESTHI
jgi:3-isopropylmalate/(R)-2-methylmalate dehydratase small subunit